MDTLLQDLRYGARSLIRTPWFALAAMLTIGIGAGANATVFSFVDALLFRPAAGVADPASLVTIYTSDFSSGPYGSTSYPDFVSLSSDADAFSGLAASIDQPGSLVRIGDTTERISTSAVTAEFFSLLGLKPAHGRLLAPADVNAGAPPVAVIGYEMWARVYGKDPSAVGSSMSFGGQTFTIVGVAPARFDGLDLGVAREIWTPLVPSLAAASSRGDRSLDVTGRLRPGITIEQAQAQLNAIAERLARDYPESNLGTLEHRDRPRPITVTPQTQLGAGFRGQVAMVSAVLMGAALLVLLTGCANVANLMLARGTARGREIAIRLAIGARRSRIIRQLSVESAFLGAGGGVVGVIFALWTSDVLPSFFPPEQARLLDARVDGRVLAFSLGIATLASMVFGLAPALHAVRPALGRTLRRDAQNTDEGRVAPKLRRGFVVAQVALAFVLLVASGLLVQSLRNAFQADLGFSTRQAAIVSIDLPLDITAQRARTYYDEALARVAALPGVRKTALASVVALTRGSRRGFRIEGYQPKAGEDMELPVNVVSADYFDAMGIPLRSGRVFDDRDNSGSRPVVVVNEIVARRFFPDGAVGRTVRDSRGTDFEIVGVVAAGAYLTPQSPPAPVVYYAAGQTFARSIRLVAATVVEPSTLLQPMTEALRGIDRGAAVFRPQTLQDQIDQALAADRLTASLVSACGTLALALAMIGVYGLVAYSVALRKREIGVRMALGASPHHVSRLVLKEGLLLTVTGVVLGAMISVAATTGMRSMLYRISPTDPQTFVTVPILLIAVAIAAAWIPMRRAMRMDPMGVLRQE